MPHSPIVNTITPISGHPIRRNPARTHRRQVLLVQSWWQDRVLRGVARYAAEHDWALDCRMHWTHQLPAPGSWRGDGIIAYSGITYPVPEVLRFIRAAHVPVVETQAVSRLTGSARVTIPHEAIGALAAQHLVSLDFQHFGFVTFEENLIETPRRMGFEQAVHTAGRRCYPLRFSRLAKELPRLPKPLGLMAANDLNAFSVIRVCTDGGFSVPEEVAVVGVDDTEMLCDLASTPLTSVNCNYERQGYEAAAQLDRLMDGEPAPRQPIVVPPHSVAVRRSTDTIAMPDPGAARFLRYLRDHFREPLSLGESARQLGLPLRRLQQCFRQCLGRTVIQELTLIRVEHAKRLLGERHLKVETVGLESGFASRFHFIKAFARVTGQTPREFRAALSAAELARTDKPRSPSTIEVPPTLAHPASRVRTASSRAHIEVTAPR